MTATERFLKYITFDTESDEKSASVPSTEKQKVLGACLARELADLAIQLEKAGNHSAYDQVMAAVSDFEKGNLRLSAILASLKA